MNRIYCRVHVIQGLAEELSKEGACERAIFPDSNVIVTRCAMIANLSAEGVSRCFFSSYLMCEKSIKEETITNPTSIFD